MLFQVILQVVRIPAIFSYSIILNMMFLEYDSLLPITDKDFWP